MTNPSLSAANALVEGFRLPHDTPPLTLLYGHQGAGKTDAAMLTALGLALEDDRPVFYALRSARQREKAAEVACVLVAQRYRIDASGVFQRQDAEWTVEEWGEGLLDRAEAHGRGDALMPGALERMRNLHLQDAWGTQISDLEPLVRNWLRQQQERPVNSTPVVIVDGFYHAGEAKQLLSLYGSLRCAVLLVADTEEWEGPGERAVSYLLCYANGSCRMKTRQFVLRSHEDRVEAWTEFAERSERVRRFIAEDARRDEAR